MSERATHEEIRDLLERARNLRGCGYLSASLPFFVRAVHLAPDDDEIRAELQVTRDRIHKLLAVVDACELDLARTATDWQALLRLADALVRLDREEEAVAAARQAVTIQPDNWEALFTLGNLLNSSGQFEEAAVVFDRLIAVEPDFSGGWTFKAMVLCNLRRYADALPLLYRAVTLNPNDVGGWAHTVLALTALGRKKEAHAARKRERAARLASDVARWRPRDSDDDEDIDEDAD
jgi:tetratricopeptide (TPR) repeat protein